MNFHLPGVLASMSLLFSIAISVSGQTMSLSFNPSKLYDDSLDKLREKCIDLFPQLRQLDLQDLTTTGIPDFTTIQPLEEETTTELLTITTTIENSLDDAPDKKTEEPEETISTTVSSLPTVEGSPTTTIYDDQTSATTESPVTTTKSPVTTTKSSEKLGKRAGKQLDIPDANLVTDSIPSADAESLVRLIMDLTKKIENLESTQRALHENIDDLHKKLETPQVVKQKETVADLASGDPTTAVDNWKELAQNVSSADELGNITKTIVEEALDQGAPPTGVMDFCNKLPSPQAQESAYSAVSDKLNGSEAIQEELYWKDMTPYCQQAAQNIGPYNPSTIKMYNVQNQIRLNAARPIAQTSRNIQYQEYQPAVFNWLTMVRDIPDSPPQLEINMQRMMLRTYAGNPVNLPFAFHFILILPHNQGYFKQVAYRCLTQEMKANGHYYNPNDQQSNSQEG